jgi:hypothetical protein
MEVVALSLSPNVDTLPQFLSPVLTHLLAAVALPVGQDKYPFDTKA